MSSPQLISMIDKFRRERDMANRDYEACNNLSRTVDLILTFPWTNPSMEHFPQDLRPPVSFIPGYSNFSSSLTMDTYSAPQTAVDAAVSWIRYKGNGGYAVNVPFPGKLKISPTSDLPSTSSSAEVPISKRPLLIVRRKNSSHSDSEPELPLV